MPALNENREVKETGYAEKKKSFDLARPIKAVAITAACAGVGIIGAIGAVTVAAVGEIVLPAALCLKVAGITGGAIGLALGIGRKKT